MLSVFISTYIYCFQILLYFLVIWKVIHFQQMKNIVSCFKTTSALFIERTPLTYKLSQLIKICFAFSFYNARGGTQSLAHYVPGRKYTLMAERCKAFPARGHQQTISIMELKSSENGINLVVPATSHPKVWLPVLFTVCPRTLALSHQEELVKHAWGT